MSSIEYTKGAFGALHLALTCTFKTTREESIAAYIGQPITRSSTPYPIPHKYIHFPISEPLFEQQVFLLPLPTI